MPGVKEIAIQRKDIFIIDPHKLIEEDGFNARQEGPELTEYICALADYIQQNGVPGILDVYVKGDDVIVVDGHCRRRAAIMAMDRGAELKGVRCNVLDRYLSDIDRTARLVTANQGRPLSPLEQSDIIKRLRVFGLSNKEIAGKIGKSEATVSNLLALGGAPAEVRQMVVDKKVTATTVVQTIRKDGEKAADSLRDGVSRAAADGKSRASKTYVINKEKTSKDVIGQAKKLVRTFDAEQWLEWQDWMVEEQVRREEAEIKK